MLTEVKEVSWFDDKEQSFIEWIEYHKEHSWLKQDLKGKTRRFVISKL